MLKARVATQLELCLAEERRSVQVPTTVDSADGGGGGGNGDGDGDEVMSEQLPAPSSWPPSVSRLKLAVSEMQLEALRSDWVAINREKRRMWTHDAGAGADAAAATSESKTASKGCAAAASVGASGAGKTVAKRGRGRPKKAKNAKVASLDMEAVGSDAEVVKSGENAVKAAFSGAPEAVDEVGASGGGNAASATPSTVGPADAPSKAKATAVPSDRGVKAGSSSTKKDAEVTPMLVVAAGAASAWSLRDGNGATERSSVTPRKEVINAPSGGDGDDTSKGSRANPTSTGGAPYSHSAAEREKGGPVEPLSGERKGTDTGRKVRGEEGGENKVKGSRGGGEGGNKPRLVDAILTRSREPTDEESYSSAMVSGPGEKERASAKRGENGVSVNKSGEYTRSHDGDRRGGRRDDRDGDGHGDKCDDRHEGRRDDRRADRIEQWVDDRHDDGRHDRLENGIDGRVDDRRDGRRDGRAGSADSRSSDGSSGSSYRSRSASRDSRLEGSKRDASGSAPRATDKGKGARRRDESRHVIRSRRSRRTLDESENGDNRRDSRLPSLSRHPRSSSRPLAEPRRSPSWPARSRSKIGRLRSAARRRRDSRDLVEGDDSRRDSRDRAKADGSRGLSRDGGYGERSRGKGDESREVSRDGGYGERPRGGSGVSDGRTERKDDGRNERRRERRSERSRSRDFSSPPVLRRDRSVFRRSPGSRDRSARGDSRRGYSRDSRRRPSDSELGGDSSSGGGGDSGSGGSGSDSGGGGGGPMRRGMSRQRRLESDESYDSHRGRGRTGHDSRERRRGSPVEKEGDRRHESCQRGDGRRGSHVSGCGSIPRKPDGDRRLPSDSKVYDDRSSGGISSGSGSGSGGGKGGPLRRGISRQRKLESDYGDSHRDGGRRDHASRERCRGSPVKKEGDRRHESHRRDDHRRGKRDSDCLIPRERGAHSPGRGARGAPPSRGARRDDHHRSRDRRSRETGSSQDYRSHGRQSPDRRRSRENSRRSPERRSQTGRSVRQGSRDANGGRDRGQGDGRDHASRAPLGRRDASLSRSPGRGERSPSMPATRVARWRVDSAEGGCGVKISGDGRALGLQHCDRREMGRGKEKGRRPGLGGGAGVGLTLAGAVVGRGVAMADAVGGDAAGDRSDSPWSEVSDTEIGAMRSLMEIHGTDWRRVLGVESEEKLKMEMEEIRIRVGQEAGELPPTEDQAKMPRIVVSVMIPKASRKLPRDVHRKLLDSFQVMILEPLYYPVCSTTVSGRVGCCSSLLCEAVMRWGFCFWVGVVGWVGMTRLWMKGRGMFSPLLSA